MAADQWRRYSLAAMRNMRSVFAALACTSAISSMGFLYPWKRLLAEAEVYYLDRTNTACALLQLHSPLMGQGTRFDATKCFLPMHVMFVSSAHMPHPPQYSMQVRLSALIVAKQDCTEALNYCSTACMIYRPTQHCSMCVYVQLPVYVCRCITTCVYVYAH